MRDGTSVPTCLCLQHGARRAGWLACCGCQPTLSISCRECLEPARGTDDVALYAITTDGEAAIRAGLRASSLTPTTVQVLGSIHLKWAVSAHRVGPGTTTFGKAASELWSRHMQFAEGPLGFDHGVQVLRQTYAEDTERLVYINNLAANAETTAHYMREDLFTNGCLTDITETLISAAKRWDKTTSGKTAQTLFLSLVSMSRGCRRLAARPYLKCATDRKNGLAGRVNGLRSRASRKLFTHLVQNTTHAACEGMLDEFETNRDRYKLFEDVDQSDLYIVTHKLGDQQIVTPGPGLDGSVGTRRRLLVR